MTDDVLSSDTTILDLLRRLDEMTVTQLSDVLDVTATAVRQRLNRLMAHGYVERRISRKGRGRPSHAYSLTQAGRRKTGANFADLAIALWQEIRSVKDPDVRRGLLQRISRRMVEIYASEIQGETVEEKMNSLAQLFGGRSIPFEVDYQNDLPVLTALACPYPDLAEQDRTICAVERMMFSELLGENVRLGKCRLDGENCCTFELSATGN